jgi:hypothetical protein
VRAVRDVAGDSVRRARFDAGRRAAARVIIADDAQTYTAPIVMRARSLKPSIFKNELLAVADPLYTVIFEGLWCLADREGRLEDRPGKIHIEINPGRAFEGTANALVWLSDRHFIRRYSIDGVGYIEVVNFLKHQNPHQKEAPSKIPKPEASIGLNGHAIPVEHSASTGFYTRAGPPEHGANTVLNGHSSTESMMPEPDEHQKSTVLARLTPDSGLLTPDSKTPKPPLGKGAARRRRSPERAKTDEAREKWRALIDSNGEKRDDAVQRAISAIGGWSRIKQRREGEEPALIREFCDAYVQAASGA